MGKYIIELDDDIAKGIRGENECEVEPREIVRSFQATIADAIANGTPYNPTGDLISREALEKSMRKSINERYKHWDKPITVADIATLIFDEIDNAQAISLPNEQIISDIPKDYLYDTETAEFYVYRNKYTGKEIHIVKNPPAYILDKRSKGEWTTDEAGYFYCDKCKQHPYNQYAMTNFCPNCGADMQKGGAE